MKIEKVGIAGCGVMGSEYVHVCARAGYAVIFSEIDETSLEKGLDKVASRLSSKEDKIILSRIKGTTDSRDFSNCDIVIEAVPENLEIKKRLFAYLDGICPKQAILATNTSVLSVTGMARATTRPEKVLGIHGSPLNVPISEIIKTVLTSDETLKTACNFVNSLGLRTIIVPDVPGFMSNRIWQAFLMAAVRVLEAGISTRDEIDSFFTEGFGLPVGPLQAIDRGGLDTVLFANTALYDELKDPTYKPPEMIKKMVAAGWLGCKTGRGFYEY